MSLKHGLQIVANASIYVASPTNSSGSSPVVESPANSNQGGLVSTWLTANGQTPPAAWGAAFVRAVYANLNFDIGVTGTTPEALWRSAFAKDLLAPVPAKGGLALQLRANEEGLLDESNIYASSTVGIFCRYDPSGRKLLLIQGNTVIDDGTNDGVVMRFFDAEAPVASDGSIKFAFITPSLLRHGAR